MDFPQGYGMIRQSAYGVEPWCVREARLDLDVLSQSESVFALSNGHVGLRGNLDEGEPHGLPGTYLNSLYEVRPFRLFHILQAGARAECRPIAAKGLTGPGYDGHTFWDTETFVLPVLTYTQPSAVANVLRWRHMVLPEARQRAACLGLAGTAFPWRTIRAQECSGYWPAGTAAFHINADIADAGPPVRRCYRRRTLRTRNRP
jgi:trehalose/maltose hydrolase-like predicted phosphorylase